MYLLMIFGKGYSSLSALKDLPVTCLKIDKAFINNIPEDRNNVAVVEAIIKWHIISV
jgi:sensor c-di-GMP phosphodiesterase-like protein